MIDTQVIAKASNKMLIETSTNRVQLLEPSLVVLKQSPENIAETIKQGNDLIIRLENGENIVIEGFFQNPEAHSLMFKSDEGQSLWAKVTITGDHSLDMVFTEPASIQTPAEAVIASESTNFWPFVIGGGVIAGVAAVIVAASGGSDSNSNSPAPVVNLPPERIAVANVNNIPFESMMAETSTSQQDFNDQIDSMTAAQSTNPNASEAPATFQDQPAAEKLPPATESDRSTSEEHYLIPDYTANASAIASFASVVVQPVFIG